jgi:hypothetical protein
MELVEDCILWWAAVVLDLATLFIALNVRSRVSFCVYLAIIQKDNHNQGLKFDDILPALFP